MWFDNANFETITELSIAINDIVKDIFEDEVLTDVENE